MEIKCQINSCLAIYSVLSFYLRIQPKKQARCELKTIGWQKDHDSGCLNIFIEVCYKIKSWMFRHIAKGSTSIHYNLIYNCTNMRLQCTRTKQLRAPLTTTLGHPKSTQCNFNSCTFNYKSDYIIATF